MDLKAVIAKKKKKALCVGVFHPGAWFLHAASAAPLVLLLTGFSGLTEQPLSLSNQV